MKSSPSFSASPPSEVPHSTRPKSSRAFQVLLALSLLFGFSYVSGQAAFTTTSISTLEMWDEGSPTASQLNTLNTAITNTLGSTRSDYCFMLETEPVDILQFASALNCSHDGSGMMDGFRPATNLVGLNLGGGAQQFDYEARVAHTLKLTGYDVTSNPPVESNSLTVIFELANVDEPPVFKTGFTFNERRNLQVNDRIDYTIFDIYEDPEGAPLSIDVADIQVCEPAAVNTTSPLPCKAKTATGVISGDHVSTQPRGPRLYITADGPNLTAAGFYYATVTFRASDPAGNTSSNSQIRIFIKSGANNVPRFRGGATGFTASVDERPLTDTGGYVIGPSTALAWSAEDLDGDSLFYSLVGEQPDCRDIIGGRYVRIGNMCIYELTNSRMGMPNAQVQGYFFDYEDPALAQDKSFTVMLRASDGWDHVDIPVKVTINDINELYLHSNPSMGAVLEPSYSVIEGESVTINLANYVTDPENDTLTYTAYAHAYTGLVDVSGSTLTINGTGTSTSIPTITDTVTIEVTDGQLTEMRDISVRVRNVNEAPRFEPVGVRVVAGTIDENVPVGTAVSGLVQYVDADSTADELSVIVSSSAFDAIVDPLLEDGVLCDVASATCVAQVGRIVLVTAAELNYEDIAQHEVKLGLHDGWARSDANADVTMRITVNDKNDAPVAQGSIPNQAVSVNGVATFDASVYFADEDQSDRILVSATSRDPSIASVSVAGAAEITVEGESVGTSRIEVTATDPDGEIATQLFDVVVSANRAPVAQSDAFLAALPENSELLPGDIVDVSLAGFFVDPDGDDIEIDVESLNSNILLVTVSEDDQTLTLVARALGSTDLVFTATDSAGNTTTEIRTLHVVSVLSSTNEPPTVDQAALDKALPSDLKMVVGNFHDINLSGIFSDPDGGDLAVRIATSNIDVLQIQASDETDTLTLFAVGVGTADLSIAATDEGDLTTEVVVTITVVADTQVVENQAPVLDMKAFEEALPPDRSIVLRRFFSMDLGGLFSDPDGDEISLTAASSDESVLRVSLRQNGMAAFLIARAVGNADLTITATDSEGNATEAKASINVIEQVTNKPPEIDRDALVAALPTNNTLPAGEFFELQLDTLFSDPDGNDDIVSLEGFSSDLDVLDVSVDDNHLLTALALSPGDAVLSLIAKDDAGAETKVDETITVTAASASSLAIASQSFDRSAPLTLALDEMTQDPRTLSALDDLQSRVQDPSILQASLEGGSLTLHALTQGRTFVKLYSANDSDQQIRAMFYVDVVNAAPSLLATLSDQSTTRTSDLTIDVGGLFADADGESFHLTASISDDSIAGIKLSDGSLTVTGLQVGETVVTIAATDVHGAKTETSFKLTIENVGPTVIAQSGPIQLQVGGARYDLEFATWFADDDGDPLSFTTTLSTQGIVEASVSTSNISLAPMSRGSTLITVTATDEFGSSVTASANIVVGDDKLKDIAAKSLAGFGRSMLSSVSSVIDTRANMDRGSSDFSDESVPLDAFEQTPHSNTLSQARSNADLSYEDALAWSSLSDSALNETRLDRSNPSTSSLFGNGFTINLGSRDKPSTWSAWSNMDRQAFGGEDYDGSITNTYVGIDAQLRDSWLLGVAVARHQGESSYSFGTATQRMNVELDQLMPYARYVPVDGTRFWGTFGIGSGELATTVVGSDDSSSRLSNRLAVLGGRHRIADCFPFELAVRGDLAATSLATRAGESASDAIVANVHRMRVGLEGNLALTFTNDISLTPFGEVNLRSDGGDGDAGTGLEFTGGMKVAYRSFEFELTGRRFDVTDEQRYSEHGVSMTATVNPSMDGTGFTASISPRWGADTRSHDLIWQDQMSFTRQHAVDNSDLRHEDSNMQFDAQIGYGLRVASERFLLTPFVQFAGAGQERQQTQFGTQLRQLVVGNTSLSVRFTVGKTQTPHRAAEEFAGASLNLGF